jgi:hypothetical protein
MAPPVCPRHTFPSFPQARTHMSSQPPASWFRAGSAPADAAPAGAVAVPFAAATPAIRPLGPVIRALTRPVLRGWLPKARSEAARRVMGRRVRPANTVLALLVGVFAAAA